MGKDTKLSGPAALASVLLTQLGFAGFGWWLAGRLGVDLGPALAPTVEAIAIGIGAALLFYGGILGSRHLFPGVWRDLDVLVRKIYGESGLPLSWPAILALSAAAGIGEELLFRGALQGWLAQDWPLTPAIAVPSIGFAVLHPYSRAYVAYAFVIGCLLGLLYAWSGSLLAAVIAHGLYDVLALARLRRELVRRS